MGAVLRLRLGQPGPSLLVGPTAHQQPPDGNGGIEVIGIDHEIATVVVERLSPHPAGAILVEQSGEGVAVKMPGGRPEIGRGGITGGDEAVAYTRDYLRKVGIENATVGEKKIVLAHLPEHDVIVAFDRTIDGRELTVGISRTRYKEATE